MKTILIILFLFVLCPDSTLRDSIKIKKMPEKAMVQEQMMNDMDSIKATLKILLEELKEKKNLEEKK